jgi:acetylornithine deacetylase/succinyl-diaminopimelate desuccinylase-like protein
MKANEFKKLIKEAVREAIREELTGGLEHTVQESSTPPPPPVRSNNPLMDMLAETRATMTNSDYSNIVGANSSMAQNFDRSMFTPKRNFSPTSDDPRSIEAAIAQAPKTGIDISQLSFVKNAAAIVNAAEKKQKEKYGL